MRRWNLALLVIIAGLVVGCMQPVGGVNPPKPDRTRPVASTLEALAFESFQSRDRLRAMKLRGLKGTPYDLRRQQAIEQAGAEASRESWAPVAAALAERLDKLPQDDQAAFDAVIEDLARGAERAAR